MTTNKQILEVADKMSEAIEKLTNGLAKDGVAIEGFIHALEVREEYAKIKLKRQFELFYNRSIKPNGFSIK